MRKLGSAPVRTRLFVLAGVLLVMWIAAAAVSVIGLLSTRSSADRAAQVFSAFRAERDAYEGWLTQDDQSNMYSALASLHQASQAGLLNQTWQQVLAGHAQAVAQLAKANALTQDPRIHRLITHTAADLRAYTVFTNQVHQDVGAGNFRGAIRVMSISNLQISNATQADFDRVGGLLSAQATAVKSDVGATVNQSLLLLLLLAAISLPLAVALVLWIVRSITRPLEKVTAAARRIAQGHVDIILDVTGDDEIGQVAAAFRASVEHLAEMAHAADQIAAGNLAVTVEPKSEGDRLGQAFLEMSRTLRQALGEQSCLAQLTQRMSQLNDCLDGLGQGLQSMNAGDLTMTVATNLEPITGRPGAELGALAEYFNAMLVQARGSLEAYNEMRETLRRALGDQSSLEALTQRLQSLHGHCLTDLEHGLAAMQDGDMTVAVSAVTHPIAAAAGTNIGELASTFNGMLATAQASIVSYNAMREELRSSLGDQSCLEELSDRLGSLHGHCLTDLQHGLEAMQQGRLNVSAQAVTSPLEVAAGHEAGHLAEVFNGMLSTAQSSIESYNAMRGKLSEMIREIARSSESLAGASQQMAATSDQTGRAVEEIAQAVGSVASGAEQQVRAVEDVRAVTVQLADTSQGSARGAQDAARAAEQARGLARAGVQAAEEANSVMQSVQQASQQATEAIRALGEKSDKIGSIVETITGIAAQTNLLALNAAIEAARAGEQGRGFAVVADEVRKLAEESQDAAATIARLIRHIQEDTARAVEVVERGANETHTGVRTVEQARNAFVEIGVSVEDVGLRVSDIAGAIEQIAASGSHVQSSIDAVAAVAEQSSAATEQVSASTEETSASTQQIAASAQQLAATADELEGLVKQFVVA